MTQPTLSVGQRVWLTETGRYVNGRDAMTLAVLGTKMILGVWTMDGFVSLEGRTDA